MQRLHTQRLYMQRLYMQRLCPYLLPVSLEAQQLLHHAVVLGLGQEVVRVELRAPPHTTTPHAAPHMFRVEAAVSRATVVAERRGAEGLGGCRTLSSSTAMRSAVLCTRQSERAS